MESKNAKFRISPEKIYQLVLICYFLALELISWVLDWNEFQVQRRLDGLPSGFVYFWHGMFNYIFKHWEAELWLLIYKLSTLVLLLYMGASIYNKEQDPPSKEIVI